MYSFCCPSCKEIEIRISYTPERTSHAQNHSPTRSLSFLTMSDSEMYSSDVEGTELVCPGTVTGSHMLPTV